MADLATRSLGIGYPGGSILLLGAVLTSLFIWHRALGTISISSVHEPKAELYYWLTITFSQTLGTALGDWIADVERPAEQYRGRYALRFEEARELIEKGKAQAGAGGGGGGAAIDPTDVAPPAGHGGSGAIDPTQFGLDGHCGHLTPEAQQLLDNGCATDLAFHADDILQIRWTVNIDHACHALWRCSMKRTVRRQLMPRREPERQMSP